MIAAKIICDSVSDKNVRLTTMELVYPRFFHAELLTHRAFSRNSSSSRAIPVQKMLDEVGNNPAVPSYWGINEPGMQAHVEAPLPLRNKAISEWLQARDDAVRHAHRLMALGLHKQTVNRLLEPFAHIRVVVSTTHFRNFFALRRHPDALPEFRLLADAMHAALSNSIPNKLYPGDWHLPYLGGDEEWPEEDGDPIGTAIKVSVARCARVSYRTHSGNKPSVAADLKLYERLVGSIPLHASPCEHQATPDVWHEIEEAWDTPEDHGNFTAWRQYRKILERRTFERE